MEFVRYIVLAIVILAVGLLIKVKSPVGFWLGDFGFLAGALGAQICLFVAALRLRNRSIPRFDMIVASEVIIALGVVSLILGIVIAVFLAFSGDVLPQTMTFETLRPLLMPFAEGLLAAGMAPLFATVLRQIEVLKYGSDRDGGDTSATVDLDDLREKVLETTNALNAFITACERSQTTFEKSATSFNKSADLFEVAAKRTQIALESVSHAATTGSAQLATGLAGVTMELATYRDSLASSTSQMTALTSETREFQAAVREGTTKLNAAVKEGATLLDGLGKLIDSVERFISPDR